MGDEDKNIGDAVGDHKDIAAPKPNRRKKKQSARERGYFPRTEAAQSLRQIADTLESTPDGSLVKFSLNVWATPDDEAEARTNER